MGNQYKADQEFKRCVELIRNDQRSTRMFQRYAHKMELLNEYFIIGEKELLQTQIPEVITVLPTITGPALTGPKL